MGQIYVNEKFRCADTHWSDVQWSHDEVTWAFPYGATVESQALNTDTQVNSASYPQQDHMLRSSLQQI